MIYKINCKRCNEFYIGKTVDLKSRVSKHKSDIKLREQRTLDNKYVMKISQHFSTCCPKVKYPIKIVTFSKVAKYSPSSFIDGGGLISSKIQT